jgi:cellobiose phosphorylase
MYRVVLDYIFGARSGYDGLIIDPVIPADWKDFTLERVYRGTRYIIHVSNPAGVQSGVKEIRVDGKLIDGSVLPLSEAGLCRVEVALGE